MVDIVSKYLLPNNTITKLQNASLIFERFRINVGYDG